MKYLNVEELIDAVGIMGKTETASMARATVEFVMNLLASELSEMTGIPSRAASTDGGMPGGFLVAFGGGPPGQAWPRRLSEFDPEGVL